MVSLRPKHINLPRNYGDFEKSNSFQVFSKCDESIHLKHTCVETSLLEREVTLFMDNSRSVTFPENEADESVISYSLEFLLMLRSTFSLFENLLQFPLILDQR